MPQSLMKLSVLTAALAFGAACAALALMGIGVPFLAATLAAAVCAGMAMHAMAGPRHSVAAAQIPAADSTTPCRVRELEEQLSSLRHDLRGVLSPALMMSDRLLTNDDPRVRRAGEAVVRSVERATELLAATRPVMRPVMGPAPGNAAAPAVQATRSR